MSAARHIVVVGAGIVGASIAWHLARAGARVTVVAAGGAGGIATPATFAWINASWGNPQPYFRLRSRSMREWVRLAAELPPVGLSWCGGLCWDMPRADLEAYAAQYGAWGYDIRLVDGAEALQIEPALAAPPTLAAYVASEGVVEPRAAVSALLGDAVGRGAVLHADLAVHRLAATGGHVTGIETDAGTIAADDVVLAAGIAVPALAATAGVEVAITTPPGLLVHSKPHPRLLNGVVLAEAAHLRQTAEGRIVAGADFTGTDPGADPGATARALFDRAKAMLRGADDLELDHFTIGLRPTPFDGFPIVGRPRQVQGLYVAVMHSGVTLAAAVGAFAAEELLAGRRDPLIEPYGHGRAPL
ncbi:MAG TPA: FAD-binding oxidoreductase [Rhizobiales bacterium]|nr:FAD-binding oxidoreductase [Hyphomicrobiales bacterium]